MQPERQQIRFTAGIQSDVPAAPQYSFGNRILLESRGNIMKHVRTLNRWLLCSALLGTLIVGGTLWAQQDDILNKKELKTLITNAKTAQDHLRLARHFGAKADQLEADAKDHFELSDSYNRRDRGFNHCAALAKELHKAAEEARQLSADHSETAKRAQK